MKTSKEMQLKILDKMRENVENDLALMNSIQYRNRVNLRWDDRIDVVGTSQFERLEMRVKPETITINGVEIPKPLDKGDLVTNTCYYCPMCSESGYYYAEGWWFELVGIKLAYATKEEAIEASKLLFGIEE